MEQAGGASAESAHPGKTAHGPDILRVSAEFAYDYSLRLRPGLGRVKWQDAPATSPGVLTGCQAVDLFRWRWHPAGHRLGHIAIGVDRVDQAIPSQMDGGGYRRIARLGVRCA